MQAIGVTGDGLCYLQIVLEKSVSTGRASFIEFGVAAETVVRQCVINYGYGGIVSKIGEWIH